jgi:spermidine/putrescine transport system ATP-binding protein/putrescine transport system ATP-binding protein
MTALDPMISVRNVGKSFGLFRAIEDLSLDIAPGEFFTLLGASGCGKTTLLRMIAGFESTSAGEIYIDSQPMSAVPPYLRPVNMVFQNYAIFPHLNVGDNIAYGLRRLGLPRAKQDAMVDEMLDLVALPGYGKRRANELSGGQRQRVALARALILKPKVLLLDEPLGALDKQLREQMQLELRRLQRSVGITFVFVTHDQEEALTLSDRIAVMAGGKILQLDSPNRLYEAPRTREVASFIGNMNFFEARVAACEQGRVQIEVEGLGRCDLAGDRITAPVGARICIAIRPEKLVAHATEPSGAVTAVQGRIEATTYLGERSLLHVRVAGRSTLLAVSAQNTTLQLDAGADEGRVVWLSWANDALVVLDQE